MMDNLYGFQSSCADYSVSMDVQATAEDMAASADNECFGSTSFPMLGSSEQSSLFSGSSVSEAASLVAEMQRSSEPEASSVTRAKIASHPLYPRLLQAYIDCQKVGAPPDMAYVLDGIQHECDSSKKSTVAAPTCLGADPELDEFMETYCQTLVNYKSDLSRPFHEATAFLSDIEAQFNTICSSGASIGNVSDEVAGSSDEDASGGEVEAQDCRYANGDQELKDKLLRKYSGCISSLKHEFLKNKKKKGKLPTEARQILLNWWGIHYKWPYPTEVDKVALANATGLDQKQINNWFINQRKRHWKPSENMQFAVMDSLYGSLFMNND